MLTLSVLNTTPKFNRHCIETAHYMREKLSSVGVSCRLNDLSSTVVLERPVDDAFVKRWQLACEEDIAQVVVMPNVTRNKIDCFVEELVESFHTRSRATGTSEFPIETTGMRFLGDKLMKTQAAMESTRCTYPKRQHVEKHD